MDNYIKHKIMGLGSRQLKPKKGVLPHRFDCQIPPAINVPGAEDRRRQRKVIGDVLNSKRKKDENTSGSNIKYLEIHVPLRC